MPYLLLLVTGNVYGCIEPLKVQHGEGLVTWTGRKQEGEAKTAIKTLHRCDMSTPEVYHVQFLCCLMPAFLGAETS